MKTIFIPLKGTAIKLNPDALASTLGSEADKDIGQEIQNFFSGKPKCIETINFLYKLLAQAQKKENIDKLLLLLSMHILLLESSQAKVDSLEKVKQVPLKPVATAKFYSWTFKSCTCDDTKVYLLEQTVALINQADLISPFNSFVENFPETVSSIRIGNGKLIELYLQMIGFLEKHLIYKAMKPQFIVKCLSKVEKDNANSQSVNLLFKKALEESNIPQNAIHVLSNKALSKNPLFELYEICLSGDFAAFERLDLSKMQPFNLNIEGVKKRTKMESIPRLVAKTKIVSYTQLAERLKIQKDQVESYIIEAIQLGILQAKLDEFDETVLIQYLFDSFSNVNFRCLRKSAERNERAQLQKDITLCCGSLQKTVELLK